MTEFERAALGAARAFADTWKEGVGKAEFVRMLKDQILHTLTAHARPAEGFVRTHEGPDMRVVSKRPQVRAGGRGGTHWTGRYLLTVDSEPAADAAKKEAADGR